VSAQAIKTFSGNAILFDLDGVLVSSTAGVTRQWRRWAEENRVDPEKLLSIAHGRRTLEVVRLMAPSLDAEAEVMKLEKREAEDTADMIVIPGAKNLVTSLPPESWGVVTSGTRYLATSRLRHAGLPQPAALITAEDVSTGKPDPEPYLKGAERLGVNPERCIVFEDAPAGIESAHHAGILAIALTTTYSQAKLAQANAIVKNLSAIEIEITEGEKALRLQVKDLCTQ
jgi:sugar-phosphatase